MTVVFAVFIIPFA